MSLRDTRWLKPSPPLAVDDDERSSESPAPSTDPTPDLEPEETPDPGSQD